MRLAASMILTLGIASLADGPQGPDACAKGFAMRAFASGVTIETVSPGARQRLERLAEPVYRFDDAARRTADGTVWVWCDSGRPRAAITLTKHRPPAGDLIG